MRSTFFSLQFISTALFCFLVLVTTLYFLLQFLEFLVDPRIGLIESYHALDNWDHKSHGVDDFDDDGQKDLLVFSGCAFLTSVNLEKIPEDRRCTANNVLPIYPSLRFPEGSIGQKFTERDSSAFDREDAFYGNDIFHSYAVKYRSQPWRMLNHQYDRSIQAFSVGSDGMLFETPVTFLDIINERLYEASQLWFFVWIPLIVVRPVIHLIDWIFTWPLPLCRFFPVCSYVEPLFTSSILVLLTLIFSHLSSRSDRTHRRR